MSDDERWTEADDIAAALEGFHPGHPVSLVQILAEAVKEPERYAVALEGLVTPESLNDWGDFSQLRSALEGLSFSSQLRSYPHAPDVAYMYLIAGEPAPRFVELGVVEVPRTLVWIWRPELGNGSWRLHHAAQEMLPPEAFPRTSPGSAPDVGAIPPRILG